MKLIVDYIPEDAKCNTHHGLDLYQSAVQRLLRAAGYRTDEEQTTEEGTD